MLAFRDAVTTQHGTTHINLLFNNAGIGGGGSFLKDDRADWDKTFGVCWFGVYYCTRAFLPLLVASDDGLHRQHQQRERLLGLPRAAHGAHRLQQRQVRGEGLLGGAARRSPSERTAREGRGRHARPHRHVDHHQHQQGARQAGRPGDGAADVAAAARADGAARYAGRRHERRRDPSGDAPAGDQLPRQRARRRRRRRRPSSSTACATTPGGFWSATMRRRSIAWCANRRRRPTSRRSCRRCTGRGPVDGPSARASPGRRTSA